jgi:hypothetical protein
LKRAQPDEEGEDSVYGGVEDGDERIHRMSAPGLWTLKVGLAPAVASA